MKAIKTYKGNLNIGEKIVSVDTDINYQAIEIKYVGTINITSLLPSNYIVANGNNKIIIVKMVKNETILNDLFSYRGMAMITECKLVKTDLTTHNLYVNKSALQMWSRLTTTWENLTDKWEDLDFDGRNNKKAYMYRKRIYDKENETFTTKKEIRKK